MSMSLDNFIDNLKVGAIALGITGFLISPFIISKSYEHYDFNRTYNQALIQHADSDNNGEVSSEEKTNFERSWRSWLKENKGITYVNSKPLDSNARTVEKSLLTIWLKEYASLNST